MEATEKMESLQARMDERLTFLENSFNAERKAYAAEIGRMKQNNFWNVIGTAVIVGTAGYFIAR